MIGIAVILLIDAAVLVLLLKAFNDEEVSFGTAFFIALGTAIGAAVLAAGLSAFMGIAGVVVAVLIAAALLAVAVSALFGVEMKRSFLIAAIFFVVHIGVVVGYRLMQS